MPSVEELNRHHPLFDASVPVTVRADNSDERTTSLVIRVLTGTRIIVGQRERLLHIELTDAEDSFFLYTLDVSEDEFHRLKHDQSLLVEFGEFPTNVIALLNACNESSPTFSAVLDTTTMPIGAHPSSSTTTPPHQGCTFNIVESNNFKVLKHLSLRFRAGTDASVKKYLAERLQQFTHNNKTLTSKVNDLTIHLTNTKKERNAAQISLDTFTARQTNQIESLTHQYSSDKTALTSNFNADLANVQRDHSKELLALQEHHETTTMDMRTRCEKLENERATLMENRAMLAAEKAQLEAAHQGSGDLITKLRDELNQLRTTNQSLDEINFNNVKQVTQMAAQLESHEQEIEDKTNVLNQMELRLEESGDQRGQLEDALSLLRENQERLHLKFQDSVQEINKGNDIIQKLQQENKQLRGKLKMKSKVLRRQESSMHEKEQEIDEYHRTQLTLEADIVRRKDENIHLSQSIKRLNEKLDESKQLLESNQQVIKWLNQEINAIQLTGRRGLGSSSASLGLQELEHSSAFRFNPKTKITSSSSTKNMASTLQYRPFSNDENARNGTAVGTATKRMTAKIKSIQAPSTSSFSTVGMFGDDVPLPLQSAP